MKSNQDDIHENDRWRLRLAMHHDNPLVHKPCKATLENPALCQPIEKTSSTIWRRRIPESGYHSPKVRPRVSNHEHRVAALSMPRTTKSPVFEF
ncbi:hypothetical protein THRCLA_21007 [Thraustotheca clavata]|uniref:Uncharacterized protein n=1 Tax=Thraustotheca clavata TaxID=74557 RepID=A0A1W0A137_9STRA|nr:hypothetical protein THRCLA_21007 [Thraustotheca clavata]